MSEIIGRLNRTIEAQGPDSLWVQSRDALAAAYETIAALHERTAVLAAERDAAQRIIETHTCGENVELAYRRALEAQNDRDRYRAAIEDALPMLALFRPWDVSPEQIENVRVILARAVTDRAGGEQ